MKNYILDIPYLDALQVFSRFAHQPASIFLDSAHLMKGCGRYSFIAVEPFQLLSSKNNQICLNGQITVGNPFEILREELLRFNSSQNNIPFSGGVAGYFSYDLYQHLESISSQQKDDIKFNDMVLGFYDAIIGFDHVAKKSWITGIDNNSYIKDKCARLANEIFKPFDYKYSFKPMDHLNSNFTEKSYCEAVEKVKDYILAGDIFEANISQRFLAALPQDFDPFSFYCNLRKLNPAPFASFMNLEDTLLISASPERFLKCENGKIEVRPIKGTRPRLQDVNADKKNCEALLNSEKDRAENIMIVDLMRNDLSKVCEPDSVNVTKLCGLETYATVHHLVSVVEGKLKDEHSAVDLLTASFPGGSITGAPKIRAMEIIAEIEPTFRGPYCGAFGYIDFAGNMDLAMTIRTAAIKNKQIVFQAGGAVVLDSNPRAEYLETLTKARAMQNALKNNYLANSICEEMV